MSSRPATFAPRIALHAINGVGLGHLTRLVTLAEELRDASPNAALLFLAHARDGAMLRERGLDFVSLPPRLSDPHADPDRALEGLPSSLDEGVMIAALRAFEPDLVVFDTHAPSAVVAAATAAGARTVMLLRELRPEALERLWETYTPWSFDRILVPHEADEVDLSTAPDEIPIERVGPLVRRLPAGLGVRGQTTRVPRSARGSLRVLATAGGGGQPVDADRFIDAVVAAHCRLHAKLPNLRTELVTGPYASSRRRSGKVAGLRVRGKVTKLHELAAAADVVVSQAGYNTIAELRALRKPMVVVPGQRKMEDQRARAARLAATGAAVLAEPTAGAITAAIGPLLRDSERRHAMVLAHGTRPMVPRNREIARGVLRPLGVLDARVERVVLVSHDFEPSVGGMQTMTRELARALAARGVDVRIYASRRSLPRTVERSEHDAVLRAVYPPLPGPRPIDLLGDLLVTVGHALGDAPDVIHLGHAGLGPWVPALRAAWPCVVTANVHGNDLLAPWVHHGGDEHAYRAALAWGLGRADAVVAVSDFSRRLAIEAGIPAGPVRTIPNGVDASRFQPGPWPSDLAERLGVGPDDEVVLMVSRLAARKGHRTMIRALCRILESRPRAMLLFTGTCEPLRGELAELARELGVAERVRPVGWVDPADLPDLYRLARTFVLAPDAPSDTDVEGFGIALLEAAASGLPIVASRSGGVPEAVGRSGILVEPEDPDALAAAVAELLSHREQAAALGAAARARVQAELGWDRIASRYLDLWALRLEKAAAHPARAASPGRARSGRDTQRHPRPVGLDVLLSGRAHSPHARVLAARRALRSVSHGAGLAKLARTELRARRADRLERREHLRKLVASGRHLRLRATHETGWRLTETLLDCQAIGHEPDVELKLTAFLDADVRSAIVPYVSGVQLLAGLPSSPELPCERGAAPPDASGAAGLAERLSSLTDRDVATIRALRLYLGPEATEGSPAWQRAVIEAHALRTELGRRGVTTLPPPDIMRYLSTTPSPGPPTAMIEPCNRCNLRCPTCPAGTGKIAPKPDLARSDFVRLVRELRPALRNLALWNYGEPTLHPELPELIADAKALGVGTVKTSTNGTRLGAPMGPALLGSGLDVLIVSLDGASPSTYSAFRRHGDFAQVATGIAEICRRKRELGIARPSIELQFIAMRHNQHEIDRIRELSSEWGVDRLRIKTVGADADHRDLVPTSPSLSRYDTTGTPTSRSSLCTLPWDHTVIHVDGSVTPCCYLRPDMGAEVVMGNALEAPFLSIWRGPRYQAFRLAMLERRDEMPVCRTCRGSMQGLCVAVEELAS